MDRSTKSFLKALDSLRLAKTKKDRRDLLTIALLPKSDRYLSFEAKLRILDANPNAKELGLLRKIWEVSEETSWEWPVLGARLASRYLDLGQASIASDISSRILMKDSRHPEVRKTLVLSLARLGKRQEAWDRARENGGRIPAAASAYDDLVRSLRREFER